MQPCMLQFDEADSLFGVVDDMGGMSTSQTELHLANQFQQMVESDMEASGMIIAFTTNRPHLLPKAVHSRIAVHINTDKLPPGAVWTEESIGNVLIATLRSVCKFEQLDATDAVRNALHPTTSALLAIQQEAKGMDFRRVVSACTALMQQLKASDTAPASSMKVVEELVHPTPTKAGLEALSATQRLLSSPDVLDQPMPGKEAGITIAQQFHRLWTSEAGRPEEPPARGGAELRQPAMQPLRTDIETALQLQQKPAHAEEEELVEEELVEEGPAVVTEVVEEVVEEELGEEHLIALAETSKLTGAQRSQFATVLGRALRLLCSISGEMKWTAEQIRKGDWAAAKSLEDAEKVANLQLEKTLRALLKLLRVDNANATMQDIRVDNRPVIYALAEATGDYTDRPHLLLVLVRRVSFLLALAGGGMDDRWEDTQGYNGLCRVLRFANWFPSRNELALDDTRVAMHLFIRTLLKYCTPQQQHQALELAVTHVRDTDCVDLIASMKAGWTGVLRLSVELMKQFNEAQAAVQAAQLEEYKDRAYAELDVNELETALDTTRSDPSFYKIVDDLANYEEGDEREYHTAYVLLVQQHIQRLHTIASKGSTEGRRLENLEYIRKLQPVDNLDELRAELEMPDRACATTLAISSSARLPPASILYMFQLACIQGHFSLARSIIALLASVPMVSQHAQQSPASCVNTHSTRLPAASVYVRVLMCSCACVCLRRLMPSGSRLLKAPRSSLLDS